MLPSTPRDPASTVEPDPGGRSLRTRLRDGLASFLVNSGLEQLNVRWRFRIVVLAFGLPFLAYIVWSASQQAMLEKEHVRDRARANATLIATRFEDHIEQIDRLLATISQAIGSHMAEPVLIAELVQGVRSYVPLAVDNVGVWSLDGNSITSLAPRARTSTVNVADRAYFRDAVARRDLAVEGPFRSRSTGVDIIQFARPIFDAQGAVVGVLTMAVRSTHLIEELDPNGRITNQALITIIDERGIIVSRSIEGDQFVGKQVADLRGLTAAFVDRSGTREETSIDGQRRLAGYAVVGNRPWIAMVGEPIEKVLKPVSDRLLSNLLIGLAILAGAMLIAGWVASWTTTSLIQLATDAERLGSGDLAHRSTVSTGGEIATLASNFNRMAAAIEVRDTALATSQAQLRAIADNVPEQITYVDREARYRFVNAYIGVFKNLAPEEILGKTIREVRGEEAWQAVLPAFERALQGETFSQERSLVMDGRLMHFFVTYIPDFDAERTVRGVYAFALDITIRKTAELLRIESEKRLVTITDNLPAMICYVDENRCFRFANRAWEKWFGLPLDQIMGRPFDRMMSPELAAQYDFYFLISMRGEPCEYEVEVPSRKYGSRWLHCNFVPDRDEATGQVRGVYGMLHNITKSKEAERRLTRLAQFDTLTGLANRHQFNETFERALRENDHEQTPLALMFLDIDHFKQVNDRHGHGCGDFLLKEFAHRLSDCVRPTDAVARLSGDEFVVLLEGLHSDDEPLFIARKIIAVVEKPFMLDEHFICVTASIGVAMRSHAGETASVLMKRADEALYEAKRAGRNTFRLAS